MASVKVPSKEPIAYIISSGLVIDCWIQISPQFTQQMLTIIPFLRANNLEVEDQFYGSLSTFLMRSLQTRAASQDLWDHFHGHSCGCWQESLVSHCADHFTGQMMIYEGTKELREQDITQCIP